MWWMMAVLAALIGADQALKYWTVAHLAVGQSAPLLPGVVQLTRLHNYGAAWSSLSGRTAVLLVVTTALMAAVACLLVLGGGLGNYIDRIFHGYVVDMFDLQFMAYPIFNLADCFVVVGVILGAVYYLWFYEKWDRVTKHDADSHH